MNFKKIKTMSIALACTLMISMITACSSSASAGNTKTTQDFPVEINGDVVNSKPESVAVLSATLADAVLTMGLQDKVVAVTDVYTGAEFSGAKAINSADAQAIIDSKVQVVLAEQVSEDFKNTLASAGVQVVTINASAEIGTYSRMLGEVGAAFLGATTGYNQGITDGNKIVYAVEDIKKIIPKDAVAPTVAVLYDLSGMVVTGDTLLGSAIPYAGASNVFDSSTGSRIDISQMAGLNPEYIICAQGLKDQILSMAEFADIDAVINENIYELTESQLNAKSTSIPTFALSLVEILYPELKESTKEEVVLPEDIIDDKDYSGLLEELATPEPSPTPEVVIGYQDLNPGDESEEIKTLQDRLYELGYLTTEEYDGYYGDMTVEAVKAFQEMSSLERKDGVADVETLNAIYTKEALNSDGEPLPGDDGESSASDELSSDESSEE